MAEYIDRTQAIDAIEVHMYRQDPDDRGVYPLEDWQREQNYAYDLAMEILGNLPAADVKPVVHAHFYVDDGCAYCSNCRNNFKKAILKAVKFCPMCGAQIDGYGGHPDAGPPTPYDLLHEEGGWNLQ